MVVQVQPVEGGAPGQGKGLDAFVARGTIWRCARETGPGSSASSLCGVRHPFTLVDKLALTARRPCMVVAGVAPLPR